MSVSPVLLLDLGNSRIKWTVWRAGRIGRQHAEAHDGWSSRDFEREIFREPGARRCSRALLASVAGAGPETALARAVARVLGVRPMFASSLRSAAGVTTQYREPWRLGVDRFLAVIAAHRRAAHRAACVASIGTAVTVDVVDAQGVHRGGVIAPGPGLMVRSLLDDTAGIERRARESRPRVLHRDFSADGLFARSTRSAIDRGSLLAVAALIDRAVTVSRAELGGAPRLLLTGGGAYQVSAWVPRVHEIVPDLVLRGLALYGRLELD
jgi:type III pantothenate kinase